MPEQKYRVESDLLGELQVPAEAYYGVQTQRALNNYKISNTRMCDYPEYVIAIAYVKMAAARPTPSSACWIPRSQRPSARPAARSSPASCTTSSPWT